MDRTQLIKILNWNISVEPEMDINKIISQLNSFPSKPSELIYELETMKKKGKTTIDKVDMIKKLENLY